MKLECYANAVFHFPAGSYRDAAGGGFTRVWSALHDRISAALAASPSHSR